MYSNDETIHSTSDGPGSKYLGGGWLCCLAATQGTQQTQGTQGTQGPGPLAGGTGNGWWLVLGVYQPIYWGISQPTKIEGSAKGRRRVWNTAQLPIKGYQGYVNHENMAEKMGYETNAI